MKSIVELRNLKLRLALETVKKDIIDIVGDNVRLIVYGSYARGEEREDSDVDLMVVLSDEKKTFEIVRLGHGEKRGVIRRLAPCFQNAQALPGGL